MAVKTNGYLETAATLPDDLINLLMSLASNWGDLFDLTTFKLVHLSGAMTNKIYRITWPTIHLNSPPRMVLVRIYGQGLHLFFNRDDEIRTFQCLSDHGYGPKLLGQFKQGRVEEFINARTLSAADLRDPEISLLVAAKIREFHLLDMPAPKTVVLWDRLRNWLAEARTLCSPEHTKEFHLDKLEIEISLLNKAISSSQQEIGFCHNDLQYGNIMINDKSRSLTFIDYEYASYNPVAYDIANHFCEMAADYHTETPYVLDYSKYPDLHERERFIRQYLVSAGHEPNDTEVKQLVDDAERYTLANHMFWGLWGLISAYVNHIDFDYMAYARQRFQQYSLKRPQVLPVQPDSISNDAVAIECDATLFS